MIDVEKIINWIHDYFLQNGEDCKAVIGISGGKDSTVCAALLVRALGPDRVIAVKMPCGHQHDIDVANEVIAYLGITESYHIDIAPACEATELSLPAEIRDLPQVYTNIPPRERMKVLYAIAAAKHGRVVNTCNRSEDYVGYSTKFGDTAGDFAILSQYTVKEVLEIGRQLGLPDHLIYKVPEDGLSNKTDEDNLGFSYETLDTLLLEGTHPDYETYKNIQTRHNRNAHKLRQMPHCPWFQKRKKKDELRCFEASPFDEF